MLRIEVVPRGSEFLSDHVASLDHVLKAFSQSIICCDAGAILWNEVNKVVINEPSSQGTATRQAQDGQLTPDLYPDVHFRFTRMRYCVSAEFDIRIFVDEIAQRIP